MLIYKKYLEVFTDDIEVRGDCKDATEVAEYYFGMTNSAPVKIGRYKTIEKARDALAKYKAWNTASNGYTRYFVAYIEENTYDVEDGEEVLANSGDIWDFVADV